MARNNELLISAADAKAPDRVAINSRVTYREEPTGTRRTVVIVYPSESAPSDGRISTLSPVGRSLLGQRAGSSVSIAVPGGRALTVRVLEVTS